MPSLSQHALRFLVELGQHHGVDVMRAFARAMKDGVLAQLDGRPCLEVDDEMANLPGAPWTHSRDASVPGQVAGRDALRLFP